MSNRLTLPYDSLRTTGESFPQKAAIMAKVICIGASLGGMEALQTLLPRLPADLPASLFFVRHVPSDGPRLAEVLGKSSRMPVHDAIDGELFQEGHLYVAVPDHHLIVKAECMRVTFGSRENRWRPSIDVLLRSAAVAHGANAAGVILTGALDDGVAGLAAIKRCGGLAVVQDPDDAEFPELPASAIASVDVDRRATLEELPNLFVEMASRPLMESAPPPPDLVIEARFAEMPLVDLDTASTHVGEITSLSCPDCGGPLWTVKDGEKARFRCNVGHAYSESYLLIDQREAIERAFWIALRTLEQHANLLQRIIEKGQTPGYARLVDTYRERFAQTRRDALLIRNVLTQWGAEHPHSDVQKP
jgi:two-component system chemotaxis response regulator CheB